MTEELTNEEIEAAAQSALDVSQDNPVEQEDPVEETDGDVVDESDDPVEEVFDIDSALNGVEPIDLEGKISDEEAKEKAIERGWREDGVDKYGHKISAIEFLERTPFFRKFDLMRNDIDELKTQNEKLVENSKKIAKQAIEEKKLQAEAFRKEKEALLAEGALDSDDIQRLKELDKGIESADVEDDVNDTEDEIVARFEAAKERFEKENDWYKSNRAMTALADQVGVQFAQDYYKEHNTLPEPELTFKHVLDEVKKDFPTMDKTPKQTRVASRQNRTVTGRKQDKKTINDLPEDQQSVARMVMKSAGMTEEEYLNAYER